MGERTKQEFRTVSVDMDSYNELAEIAKKEDRSISWVIKRMVKEHA